MTLVRFLIMLVLFLALNVYLFIRGRQAIPDRKAIHTIYSVIFVFASLSIFVAIFAGRFLPAWLGFVFEHVGGYWMILFIYMIAFALFGDLLRISNHFFHIFPAAITSHMPMARLLYLFGVLVALVMLSLIGFFRFSHPRVKELSIYTHRVTNRPGDLTLVMASDLHLGNVIRKGRLAKWVNQINSLNPDIIILDGDIFDHSYVAVESQNMDVELRRLHAKFGVFAIPGNHDYYTGIDRVIAYLRKSGIKVLRDSAAVVNNSLLIIGRDDLTNKNRKSLASLLEGQDAGLSLIVLDHQPHSLDESVKNQVDLHLSGHTHNGQIFPFNRFVSRIYGLGYGYRKSGNTSQYVSSGIGLWAAPIRLGTQSEIVRIHLKSGTVHVFHFPDPYFTISPLIFLENDPALKFQNLYLSHYENQIQFTVCSRNIYCLFPCSVFMQFE
jgi:predicted MPP superfamily phosphohydrolase